MSDVKKTCRTATCKHQRDLLWTCHIKCVNPALHEKLSIANMLSIMNRPVSGGVHLVAEAKLNIKSNLHGVRNGWFNWPYNFDPMWLENCDGFEDVDTVLFIDEDAGGHISEANKSGGKHNE